jgi:pimeloyl-ACP methyl ester carboxylesterase
LILNYIKYESSKHSEWVVFIHGIGGGSSIWIKQIREFKKHYNLLLVDLPGHGESSYGLKDLNGNSFYDIGNEVLRVLNYENINKAHFVGISLGTIVVRAINDINPEIVSSMVLGGAVEKFNLTAKLIISLGSSLKHFIPYMWLYKLSALILMPRKRHSESRLAFVKEATKLGKEEFIDWFNLHSQIDSLLLDCNNKNSDTPKLYIMGSEDYMFLPYIKSVVNPSRNELLLVIDKCGHVCNIEKSKEFNEMVISYLSNLSLSSLDLSNKKII